MLDESNLRSEATNELIDTEYYITLLDSKYPFILTGSKVFGNPIRNDFDFYTKDTKEIRDFLESIGFLNLNLAGPGISATYRSPDNKIDVQLMKDFDASHIAHKIMLKWGNLSEFDKIEQSKLWALVYEIISSYPCIKEYERELCDRF